MRWFRIVPIMIVACLLQVALVPAMHIAQVYPNLPVALLAFIALNGTFYEGVFTGMGIGILMDVFSTTPLGFFAVVYGLLGALVAHVRGNMFVDTPFRHMAVVFVASLVANGSVAFWECWRHGAAGASYAIWTVCGAAYTVLLFSIIMYPLRLLRRWLGLTYRVQFGNVR